MEGANEPPDPVGQSALDVLRSMASFAGNDSTLSTKLKAVNTPEPSQSDQGSMSSSTHTTSLGLSSQADVPESSSGARNPFHVDNTQLRTVPVSQQAAEIQNLGVTVYNQQEFEQGT